MRISKSAKILFHVIILTLFSMIQGKAAIGSAQVPQFSVKRGFFQKSFSVIVSSSSLTDAIMYTLDGSDPKTSITVLKKLTPATIQINPDSAYDGRGATPAVVLRACCIAPDLSKSETITQSYIFAIKVKTLSPSGKKPGPGWPEPTTSSTPQAMDYGLASDVLNDSRYKDTIDSALVAIPSISVATDLKHLFAADSGIYTHAYQDGEIWERPASIELINPNGIDGFQINASIRIRGGASRSGSNRKHAFRLFFRSDYGQSKLEFSLFEKEGVDKFDKVDLRTGQNYSWAFPDHLGEYNTMISDVFSRDLQGKMGQPYTRSRAYHLYLDGVYWGLYQTQERPEARYAESYFGGDHEDYDVVKSGDGWPASIEVTDGNFNTYQEIWNFCTTGFSSNTNYFKLQGLNVDGSRDLTKKVLVDIDNLIDCMLIVFYTGNFDYSTTKWSNNKDPRNFYAIYNRKDNNSGFKFFIHDAEHSLRTTPGEWGTWYTPDPTVGINENRVNIGTITTYLKMTVTEFTKFHPQWLHFKLSDNAEYRMRFADHVYKHFFNEGYMMPEKAKALFRTRAKEIDMAIIAESARWGDVYASPSRTKDKDWLPAINDIINNYFPVRTNIVLDQLKAASLFPSFNPPLFKSNTDTITIGTMEITPGFRLKVQKPKGVTGSIRYTIDGKDPRAIGGSAASSVLDGGDSTEITINTTTAVKARVLNGSTWSALHEIILFTGSNIKDLKVTEIHYHPADRDTVSNNEYEFLELKNTGISPVNLSQAYFSAGIAYTFPYGIIVDPGKFIVLASNKQEFNTRYGFYPLGEYTGQLDNSGETFALRTATGDTVFSIKYDDAAPWPVSPDGDGYSLVPIELNPTGDQNDGTKWRASLAIHGSPGWDDISITGNNEQKNIPAHYSLEQNFPNPFNPETKIRFTLKNSCKVRLSVYDVLGREVSMLINDIQTAGTHDVTFSGKILSGGIYLYRLQTVDATIVRKMVLLK